MAGILVYFTRAHASTNAVRGGRLLYVFFSRSAHSPPSDFLARWEPPVQQGEMDFSPAKKSFLLRQGFSPGILRRIIRTFLTLSRSPQRSPVPTSAQSLPETVEAIEQAVSPAHPFHQRATRRRNGPDCSPTSRVASIADVAPPTIKPAAGWKKTALGRNKVPNSASSHGRTLAA